MDKIFSATTSIPFSQYVGVTMENEVFAIGSGFEGLEEPIPYEFAISNTRTIGGRLYVVGSARSVVRRIDRNNWEKLNKGIHLPAQDEIKTIREQMLFWMLLVLVVWMASLKMISMPQAVKEMSGISMVMNGGKFIFPSNMLIESICCGQDGYVYIGAQSGTVFKGRKDQWKMIHRGS